MAKSNLPADARVPKFPFMRARALFGLLSLAIASTQNASAQTEAPADSARLVTVWTQDISAPPGSGGVVFTGQPMFVDGADVIVAVVEQPGKDLPARAWLERRGLKGVQWRHMLEGLPPFPIYLETALTTADAKGKAIMAVIFKNESVPSNGEYGRLLSIDLASGAVERSAPLGYPKVTAHGPPRPEDGISLGGVMRLAGGEIFIFGGDGAGPYKWWAGLRQADGGFLWDAGAPRRGYGEVREARETANGVELLIYAIASRSDYGDSNLLVRLDRKGGIVSRVDLGSPSKVEFWLVGEDGLGAITRIGKHKQLSVRDGKGVTRRFGPDLPGKVWLADRIGKWLVLTDNAHRYWLVSLEGEQIGFPNGLAVAEDGEGAFRLGADGTRPVKLMLRHKCLEPTPDHLCKRYQLALVRAEF